MKYSFINRDLGKDEFCLANNFFHRRTSSRDYLVILCYQFHLIVEKLISKDNATFQDVNTLIHTAKIVKE